jgi:mono/diheme cytochrome c family protein
MSKLLLLFTLATLSCNFEGEKGTVAPTRDLLKGKKLYANHCAGCHQDEGEGLGKVYPPLKKADYLKEHFSELPCIIRNGMHKKIIVNGQEYTYEMFGVKGVGDYEIAAICNYISSEWQVGKNEILTKEKVTQVIEACR